MVTQTINLNMVPGSVYPVVHVNQFDNDDGALIFKLYNGAAFTIPVSSAVVINGTKPDGYGFTYSASYTGNTVTADVTEQMTAVPGEVKCELRITKGTDVVGTQNFTLMVEPAALDSGTVVSDSDIPAISAASTYASEAASSAASAAAVVQTASSFTNGTPTAVSSGSINDIVTPGYYTLSGVSELPEGTDGDLWVYYTDSNSTTPLRQIFMRKGTAGTNDNNIYVRQKNSSGNWGQWWKFSDATQFPTFATMPANNYAPDDVSVLSGTNTSLFSVSLPAGINMLELSIVWPSNATGYRKIMIGASALADAGYLTQSIVAAVDGTYTIQNYTWLRKNTAATTYYITGYQNSGSTLSAKIRYTYATIPA